MGVRETYFVVYVADMDRATRFYTAAFGADVKFASPHWTSLRIAGTAVGLHPGAEGATRKIGLGFDVDDIDAACAAVEAAGGKVVVRPEHKPEDGITIGTIADTEGNELSLTLAGEH
jgi:predicted enzyme related to lactoylglutathione lyase